MASGLLSRVRFTCIPIEKKGKFICLFCGGSSCKQENWKNNPNSVIKGLDSDWITEQILAMQRPSSRLIKEFGILEQFKEHNITAVFNLEEPGEHPYCGDGIMESTGFSYDPNDLFKSRAWLWGGAEFA
jgi:protein tyrosine phosphatase domain-containing protein 1